MNDLDFSMLGTVPETFSARMEWAGSARHQVRAELARSMGGRATSTAFFFDTAEQAAAFEASCVAAERAASAQIATTKPEQENVITTSKVSQWKDGHGNVYYSATVSRSGRPIADFSCLGKRALLSSIKSAGFPAPIAGVA